jgi:hypothetical protein
LEEKQIFLYGFLKGFGIALKDGRKAEDAFFNSKSLL